MQPYLSKIIIKKKSSRCIAVLPRTRAIISARRHAAHIRRFMYYVRFSLPEAQYDEIQNALHLAAIYKAVPAGKVLA